MADVKIKPLADRVLIKPMEAEEKTARELSWPSARVPAMKRWKSKMVTLYCTGNIPVLT